jgi:hypothetical protein
MIKTVVIFFRHSDYSQHEKQFSDDTFIASQSPLSMDGTWVTRMTDMVY